ncbi:MAG: hypothetical protein ABIN25_02900 [Ginsengibacter sp.]
MKTYYKQLSICLLFVSAGLLCDAQSTTKKPVITKIEKFRPPVVNTYLGVNTNGASVTRDEANQLITLPLKITDAKANIFSIDSYHFLYRRKGVIEDEETGRKQVAFTIVSELFGKSPLPKLWIDNIQNGFQTGEELHFFDIVVKDKSGRKFFAPDLKISIQ